MVICYFCSLYCKSFQIYFIYIYKLGCWTGRQILTIYQFILIFTLVILLFVVSVLSKTLQGLEETHSKLLEDETPMYDTFESVLSERFNTFYFSAVDTCTGNRDN